MLGKARPNSDRSANEPSRPAASGALTGVSSFARRAMRPTAAVKKSAVDPAMGTLRSAASEAQNSQLPQMAAALAYRTIFGLLPVIIIALVAVKYFADEDQVRSAVERALWYSGLSGIAVNEKDIIDSAPPPPPVQVDSEPVGPAPIDSEQVDPALVEVATPEPAPDESVGPPASAAKPPLAVDKWITGMIENVNRISFKAISFIGVATLVYAALAMLVEIERAFNQIYRVPRGRSWIRRIMQYWTLLTLGPLALVATFVVGQSFAARVQSMAQSRGFELGTGVLTVSAMGYALTVVISTCFFLVAYICVPNTKVKLRPALVGALTAALLWEAGKWGFTQYLRYSAFNAQIYGALALIPLFLLWVYFTWFIVLFGLQVAYQLQHGRTKTRAQPIFDIGPTMVDPTAALVVLSAIARGFDVGRAEDAAALTKASRLPEPVVRLVLARLCERGLLHRLNPDREDAEPTFVLARSPSGIRVAEILELGHDLAESAEHDDAVQRLHRVQVDAVGDQTLASFAGLPAGVSPRVSAAGPDLQKPAPGATSQAGKSAATLA